MIYTFVYASSKMSHLMYSKGKNTTRNIILLHSLFFKNRIKMSFPVFKVLAVVIFFYELFTLVFTMFVLILKYFQAFRSICVYVYKLNALSVFPKQQQKNKRIIKMELLHYLVEQILEMFEISNRKLWMTCQMNRLINLYNFLKL